VATKRTPTQRLELFVVKVEDLVGRRGLAEKTVRARATIRFGQTLEAKFDTGDDEDFRSILMAVRPFMSEKEDVYFYSVLKTFDAHVVDAALRDEVRLVKAEWQRIWAGGVHIGMGAKIYDPLGAWKLLINGTYFHSDVDLEEEYKALPHEFRLHLGVSVASAVLLSAPLLDHVRQKVLRAFELDAVRDTFVRASKTRIG